MIDKTTFLFEKSQLRLLGLKFNLLLLGALYLYKICYLNAVSQILGFFIFCLDPFSYVDTRLCIDNCKICYSKHYRQIRVLFVFGV